MIEALPRSFTISTAVHACVVALGLVVASKASPGAAVRTITTASSVMEIAMEVEQPPVAPPPPPPPPPPAPAPPPPAAAAARAPRAPRAAAPTAPSAPAPSAPSAPAPSAPAPAPAAPAPVLTSEGGEPSMATAPAGASAAATAAIAPARSGQGTAAAAPSLPPGPSFDAGSYLAGVTARVRRHRNYPAIAQEMGLEGTVEVRVVLAPDGSFAAPPSIDESCGHEILDDEALRIVRRAAPFPPLVGRSDRVTLRVPVHFHLDV